MDRGLTVVGDHAEGLGGRVEDGEGRPLLSSERSMPGRGFLYRVFARCFRLALCHILNHRTSHKSRTQNQAQSCKPEGDGQAHCH